MNKTLLKILALLILSGLTTPALATENNVQIDFSVLQELGKFGDYSKQLPLPVRNNVPLLPKPPELPQARLQRIALNQLPPQKPAWLQQRKIQPATFPSMPAVPPPLVKSQPLSDDLLAEPAAETIRFVSIRFNEREEALPEQTYTNVKTSTLPLLQENPSWRVQIQAYADGSEHTTDARRISLARALSVRKFLINEGIEPHRMDIRALGNDTKIAPLDRVDLVFVDPAL